jgi:hypothetical protein
MRVAEGEELGSNLLHVGQRSGTKPSVLRCRHPAKVWPDGIPQRAPRRFKRACEPLAAGRNLPSWTLVGEVRICSPKFLETDLEKLMAAVSTGYTRGIAARFWQDFLLDQAKTGAHR